MAEALLAAALDDTLSLRALLEEGVDLKGKLCRVTGTSPLHIAARNCNSSSVDFLIYEFGCDVNLRGRDRGRTPLMCAMNPACGGTCHLQCSYDTVLVLTDHGADPSLTDAAGMDALDMAAAVPGVYPLLLHALMERHPDRSGRVLAAAATHADEVSVVSLLMKGHQANWASPSGKTVLMHAVESPLRSGSVGKALALIASGARVDAADATGRSVAMVAAAAGCWGAVEKLLQRGVDCSAPWRGVTIPHLLLLWAVSHPDDRWEAARRVMLALLRSGVSANIRGAASEGAAPQPLLASAIVFGHTRMVALLMDFDARAAAHPLCSLVEDMYAKREELAALRLSVRSGADALMAWGQGARAASARCAALCAAAGPVLSTKRRGFAWRRVSSRVE